MSIIEQVHGTHKASKFEPQDFISGMPDNVITNILDRLPVRDAVKIDVLSKYWKFKWTLLTHLIFDDDFCSYLSEQFDGKIIRRLLLHIKGAVTKFVLYMPIEDDKVRLDFEDIEHWIIFLSRRGIKEIIIDCHNGLPCLPSQIYSCMELKHLELSFFCMLPGFHGFPNLLSLHLNNISFIKYTFEEFIARCPLLEIVSNFDDDNTCELGLIEISKLGNLKNLSWSVCNGGYEPMNMIKSSSFYELSALPKLQELNLDFGSGKFMAEAGVDKKVPAAFLCLKTLKLCDVNFGCKFMSSFVLEMICTSPNLQNLTITGADDYDEPFSAVCSLDLGCNTMKQLQLQSVSFSSYRGSANEVCLIKFILASSPLLKKIAVRVDQYFLMRHAESKRYDISWRMAAKLLNLQRASPMVDIDLC